MNLKQLVENLPKGHQAKKDYERMLKILRFLEGQDARMHQDCTRCEFLGRGDPLVDPRAVKSEDSLSCENLSVIDRTGSKSTK